jgi:hypothetical protein
MPSSEEILKSLQLAANQYSGLAILWHMLMFLFILFLYFKKPSNGLTGVALSLPLFSVSIIAFLVHNFFNGIVFTVAGLLFIGLARSAKKENISLNSSPVLRSAGIAVLIFGWAYPHFLGSGFIIYFYAAPVGLIPCPTLLTITGISMIFSIKQSTQAVISLVVLDLFYALFGVFRLEVYIDIVLLFAAIVYFFQWSIQRNKLRSGATP